MDIEISPEVAEAEGVPEDLNANVVGPYRFPSPTRRRTAGFIYLAGAFGVGLAVLVGFPAGMLGVSLALAALALYHFAAAWTLAIDEEEALTAAGTHVGFPVGHASAAVGFVGWRSRPVWNVLMFSADDPPSRRGLVRIDGVDGSLVGAPYEEDVPAV